MSHPEFCRRSGENVQASGVAVGMGTAKVVRKNEMRKKKVIKIMQEAFMELQEAFMELQEAFMELQEGFMELQEGFMELQEAFMELQEGSS